MKRSMTTVTILLAFVCVACLAKTPAQLKADLTALLPPGAIAKLCWPQKGVLYVVESDSGTIRKLSATAAMNAANPTITADGKRVVYYDYDRGATRVINWDGTGVRTLNNWYETDYWQDPATGKDWVVQSTGTSNGSVYRTNIDNANETVMLDVGNLSPGSNMTLSLDGTHLGAFYPTPTAWEAGVKDLATGVLTLEQNGGGCIANISPDNTYRFMRQVPAHQNVMICSNATSCQQTNLTDSINAWAGKNNQDTGCGSAGEFEQTRWVLPDYVTFSMDGIRANPYLMRLSDKKWTYIQEGIPCDGQAMDVRIINGTTGVFEAQATAVAHVKTLARDDSQPVCSIDGRRMAFHAGASTAVRGVTGRCLKTKGGGLRASGASTDRTGRR